MGIRALLRKNTPEIRQKINDLGIQCTNCDWTQSLVYNEKNNYVTWGDGNFDIDCGENEDFFFYLLSLITFDESNIKTQLTVLQHDYNYIRSEYDKRSTEYYELCHKYDSINCAIKESLDSIKSENDLLKEIQQLREKINKLEKENKSLKKKCNE